MKPKDNLERYFNRIFNSDIRPESWNDPGEITWNKIEQALDNHKKESSKVSLFPIILSFLLFSGSAYLLFKVKEKEIIIQKLHDKLKLCASETTDDSKTIQTDLATFHNVRNQADSNRDNISSALSGSILGNQSSKFRSNTVYPMHTINTLKIPVLSDSVFKDIQEISVYNNNPDSNAGTISLYNNIGADFAEILSAEPSETELQTKIPSSKIIDTLSEQEYPIPLKSPSDLQIGVVASYQNFILRQNSQSLIQDINVNEFFADANSVGIQFRKSLTKKLMAGIGLHYTHRTLISNYQLRLLYDHNHEISVPQPSENIDYLLHHQLPSGQGEIEVEMLLSRNINHKVPDGEIINMDFSIAGNSRILDFPLQLNYFPLESRKLFFSATLQPQVVIQRNVNVRQHNSHHKLVEEKHATAQFLDNNFRNLTLSAGLGVGFEQALSGRWIFNFQAGYMRAISYSYSTQGNKLYSDRLSAGAALFYKF